MSQATLTTDAEAGVGGTALEEEISAASSGDGVSTIGGVGVAVGVRSTDSVLGRADPEHSATDATITRNNN